MKYERKMTTFDHSHDFLEATMTIAVLMKYYNNTKMTGKKKKSKAKTTFYFKNLCHFQEASKYWFSHKLVKESGNDNCLLL